MAPDWISSRAVHHSSSRSFGKRIGSVGDSPTFTLTIWAACLPSVLRRSREPATPHPMPMACGPKSPRHKAWSAEGQGPTRFEWVHLDASLQWRAFQRLLARLRALQLRHYGAQPVGIDDALRSRRRTGGESKNQGALHLSILASGRGQLTYGRHLPDNCSSLLRKFNARKSVPCESDD